MCIRNILSSRLDQKFWKYNIKNTKTSPWKFVCEINRPTSDSKVRWKLINLNCFSPLRFSQSHQYDNNNIISKLHCPFRNPLNKKQKKKQNNEKHYHYYSQQQNKQEQKQHMKPLLYSHRWRCYYAVALNDQQIGLHCASVTLD